MKRFVSIFFICLCSFVSWGQVASRLIASQAIPADTAAPNIMWVDTVAGSMNRTWVARTSSLRFNTKQIRHLKDSVSLFTAPLYKPISYVPTNAQIISAIGYTPYNGTSNPLGFLTSVPAQSFTSLTGRPTTLSGYGIVDAYPLSTNPANYLTSINSGQIALALGFVPYPSTNPSAFISSESDPLFDSKFAAKNTGGLSEGSNLYWTTARFNTAFSGKSTADLSEGVNLYYTAARFNTAFAAKTTDGLSEGTTNQYYTNTRARGSISLTTTGSGVSTYNSTTGALNVPTPVNYTAGTGVDITAGVISASSSAVTFNNAPARTIGTSFQISTTRPARVSYTVTCTTALSLLNLNSSAQVFLEISANNSTWITINGAGSTKTLAVSISVGLNESNLFNLQCEVPAGYYVRLRGVTSGGGSSAWSYGQESIY